MPAGHTGSDEARQMHGRHLAWGLASRSISEIMHRPTLRFLSGELEEKLMCARWGEITSLPCTPVLFLLLPLSIAKMAVGTRPAFVQALLGASILIALLHITRHLIRVTPSSAASSKQIIDAAWRTQYLALAVILTMMTVQTVLVEPAPPMTSFSLDPVASAAFVLIGVITCHVMHCATALKLVVAVGPVVAHTITPIWGIGRWNEAKLMATAGVLGTATGYALEVMLRKTFYEECMKAQMAAANAKADARLNHVIKGLCGGGSAILRTIVPSLQQGGDQRAARLVNDVLEMLSQVAGWCHKRQFFVQLESSTYTTQRAPFAIGQMALDLVGNVGTVCAQPSTVSVDAIVLRLLLEEGLSNARKYRRAGTPVMIKLHLQHSPSNGDGAPDAMGSSGAEGKEEEEEGWLHMEMISVNHEQVPRMTVEECTRVLQPETKGRGIMSTTSDGLGLDTAAAAARAAGGCVWLSTHLNNANQACTVLHAMLPASEAEMEQAEDWSSFAKRHAHPDVADTEWFIDSKASSFAMDGGSSSVGRMFPMATSSETCGATGPDREGGGDGRDMVPSSVLAEALGCKPKLAPKPKPRTHGEGAGDGRDMAPEASGLDGEWAGDGRDMAPEASGLDGEWAGDGRDMAPEASGPDGEEAGDGRAIETPNSILAPEGTLKPAPKPRKQLVCFGLDDDALLRATHEIMFEAFLDADLSQSCSLGANEREVESFVDVALGRRYPDGTQRAEKGCGCLRSHLTEVASFSSSQHALFTARPVDASRPFPTPFGWVALRAIVCPVMLAPSNQLASPTPIDLLIVPYPSPLMFCLQGRSRLCCSGPEPQLSHQERQRDRLPGHRCRSPAPGGGLRGNSLHHDCFEQ